MRLFQSSAHVGIRRNQVSRKLTWRALGAILALSTANGIAAQSGIFTYTDNGSNISITDCSSAASGEISIPATIVGKPITRIEDRAFTELYSITKVTIPQGVNYIGYWAFQSCSKLATVVIPSSVTEIGSWAFSNCPALANVTLPANLTSMGLDVFFRCHSLKTMTIPAKLTSIGDGSFSDCNGLTSFSVAAGNAKYFVAGGVLFEKDLSGKTTLTQFPAGRSGQYTVPAGVVGLGASAFYGCRKLTAVTLPSSVASLEYYVFAFCDSLVSVNLPAAVTDTGPGTFSNCPKLKQIALPANLTRIGVNAFAECEALEEMVIPAKVTSIADGAFYGCVSLQNFSIAPANATYANVDGVVYNKSGTALMHFPCGRSGNFVIPDGVQKIAVQAFAGCPGLNRISFPEELTDIERGAFINCIGLNNVRLPASLATLGDYAFSGCKSLSDVYFEGAAPAIDDYKVFYRFDIPTTVHFFDGKAGFTAPSWLGYPSVNMGPEVIARPDIDVSADAVDLVSGGDILGFNATIVGNVSSREIIVHNGGNTELWGLSLRLGGTHAADFELDALGKETLVPGESVALQIRFKPAVTGTRNATVEVFSNDRSQNPFSFGLAGRGNPPLAPEIDIEQPAGQALPDGGSRAFAPTLVGKSSKLTFTVKNTGKAELAQPAFILNGADKEDFTVTIAPDSSIPAGGQAFFTVEFSPIQGGIHSAQLRVVSNDGNENPYDINLTGKATVAPEINIEQPALNGLIDGKAKKSFGTAKVGGKETVKTFTIRNTGSAILRDLVVTKGGRHAKDFVITPPDRSRLVPGATTRFKIAFKPKAMGTRYAAIHIKSNDANESPFDIKITGVGAAK